MKVISSGRRVSSAANKGISGKRGNPDAVERLNILRRRNNIDNNEKEGGKGSPAASGNTSPFGKSSRRYRMGGEGKGR